jgi:C1A family cysteine protease
MNSRKLLKSVYLFLLLILTMKTTLTNAQKTLYPLGAILLSEIEYQQLPKVNWHVLESNANKQTISAKSSRSTIMLNNPPIGDQGSQGSCVGWAVSVATSILAYPKFNNWNEARRSPSYIYNQIKVDPNDCNSGAFTTTGLNLARNQGVCSYTSMPYVNSDCMTLPNNGQRLNAIVNNILNWSTLNRSDVPGIKQALDLGFPVVIAFEVTTSFDNMWSSGGVWSTNTGTSRGGHAACIIGYDDTKQIFKVQNSWGTSKGDNGFFWVTYSLVQNNCLNEVYVVSGINLSGPVILSGPNNLCGTNTGTYQIENLPHSASVIWNSNNPNIPIHPTTGVVTHNLSTSGISQSGTITASVQLPGIPNSVELTKTIIVGTVPALSRIGTQKQYFPIDYGLSCSFTDAITYDDAPLCSSKGFIAGAWAQVSSNSLYLGHAISSYIPNSGYTLKKPSGVSNAIEVQVQNACGWSDWKTIIYPYNGNFCGGGLGNECCIECICYSYAPNPVGDELEVAFIQLPATKNAAETYSVKLLNGSGRVLRKTSFRHQSRELARSKSVKIDVSKLNEGTYFLHIEANGEIHKEQIIVKRK